MSRRELLIGCGNSRKKLIGFEGLPQEWENLTTLDIDPNAGADVVHDLDVLPYPFEDNTFDEIHAYEVLEHCGTQGDWRFFLAQFSEFWRILKPDGFLIGTCPMWDSPWAWADPGHRRVISRHSLVFLSQAEYADQVGRTHMADYRSVYSADFETMATKDNDANWGFVLRAIK